MTRLWIDTEFNEFRGELISIAIVSECGLNFYEAVRFDAEPGPWVRQHVMPIIGVPAIEYAEMQAKLSNFLQQFSDIELIADWPEDIKHFLDALITGPGMRIGPQKFSMCVDGSLPSTAEHSKIPHNSFYDALALKDAAVS